MMEGALFFAFGHVSGVWVSSSRGRVVRQYFRLNNLLSACFLYSRLQLRIQNASHLGPKCRLRMTTRLRQALRNWADGHGFISVLLNARRIAEGYQPIFLDYPVKALPRYGYGKPPHPELAQILSARDETYRALLQEFLRFRSHL